MAGLYHSVEIKLTYCFDGKAFNKTHATHTLYLSIAVEIVLQGNLLPVWKGFLWKQHHPRMSERSPEMWSETEHSNCH